MKIFRAQNFFLILGVAVIYFIFARLSLLLDFQNSNATPVWPPSGIAFAAALILGRKIFPGIVIGAFAANLTVFLTNHTCAPLTAIWTSMIIAIGNTLEVT